MELLAERLAEAGWRVENVAYPSTDHDIEALARIAVPEGIERCGGERAERIDFVTHSLGGILVRAYFQQSTPENLGRVVMLGPPNQGSEIVDSVADWPGFDWLNGPAGRQLAAHPDSYVRQLGPVSFELGVIAGTDSINPLSPLLPKPNDGTVSVAATRVEGMRDWIALPVTHTFMMRDDAVMAQTIMFLRTGRFARIDGG